MFQQLYSDFNHFMSSIHLQPLSTNLELILLFIFVFLTFYSYLLQQDTRKRLLKKYKQPTVANLMKEEVDLIIKEGIKAKYKLFLVNTIYTAYIPIFLFFFKDIPFLNRLIIIFMLLAYIVMNNYYYNAILNLAIQKENNPHMDTQKIVNHLEWIKDSVTFGKEYKKEADNKGELINLIKKNPDLIKEDMKNIEMFEVPNRDSLYFKSRKTNMFYELYKDNINNKWVLEAFTYVFSSKSAYLFNEINIKKEKLKAIIEPLFVLIAIILMLIIRF